jgi:acyl-coenzyme A synthetase/AMP-(fatty) acid ligase
MTGSLTQRLPVYDVSERPAIIAGDREIRYRELLEILVRLSSDESKDEKEAVVEGIVGIIMDHSLDTIIVLLSLIDQGIPFLVIDNQVSSFEFARLKELVHPIVWIACDHQWLIDKDIDTSQIVSSAEFLAGRRVNVLQNKADPCYYQLTSGSTGYMKIACIPQKAIFLGGEFYRSWFGIRSEDIAVSTIQLTYSYGMIGGLMGCLLAGCTFLFCEHPSPRTIADLIKRFKANVLYSVPVLYQLLCQSDTIAASMLESLRLAISSGSALTRAVKECFFTKFNCRILQVYGSTETGAIAASHPDRDHYEEAAGYLLPNVKAKVLHDGRLQIQSQTLFRGYYPGPFKQKEFHVMDDIVNIKGGQVVLIGRTNSFINVAGRKVDPAEVASVIRSFKGIKQVRVFGILDSVYGEKIIAEIQASEVINHENLKNFLHRKLSPHKVPHEIREVSTLTVPWKQRYQT